MPKRITRRAVLAVFPAGLAAAAQSSSRKTRPLPNAGEFVRFADPTTETPVVRLTSPATTSLFPAATNRFVSLKQRFLVFSSDRAGKAAPFQLDLRSGLLTMLARTDHLDPSSLCLDERGRIVYLLDGGKLKEITLATKRLRVLGENITAFSTGASSEFVVIRQGRLERLDPAQGPLAENVGSWCLIQPGAKGCLFTRDASVPEQGESPREFWYVSFSEGTGGIPKRLAQGRISDPFWSPDGQSLLFLRDVEAGSMVTSEIHEVVAETGEERRVSRTSQFAAFAPNSDASVFVGASRSKAQPTVVLLIRSVQRELTLCEHRASHASSVSPVFSPDSRRVYFQSDHQGKSALYSVNVERLVEPTAATAI